MTENSSIIKLNVGGKLFQTTASTLRGSKVLTRMLDGAVPTVKDETGAYFIDRDPKYFKIILSFLRTFSWDVPPKMDIDRLKEEAEFYMINTPELLRKPTSVKGPDLDGKTGFYTEQNGMDFLLFMNGQCFSWMCEPVAAEILMHSFLLPYSKDRRYKGQFTNNYQSLILQTSRDETFYMDHFPPQRPKVTTDYEMYSSRINESISIEASPNSIKLFLRNCLGDRATLIGEGYYETDNSTGFIFASFFRFNFKFKAYMFDPFMVVDMDGVWTTLKKK